MIYQYNRYQNKFYNSYMIKTENLKETDLKLKIK